LRRVAAFEPEIIKIDVSNTQRLASDHHQRELVSETVRMARQFGAFVVAEGIESSEQISVALELGVDAGQGLLLDLSASMVA
jgi:EAL domain-containing protein (putative c-di-GMP-specific phosphodiesterase class I)